MGLEAVSVGEPTRVLTYSDVVKDLGRTMTHAEIQLATIVIELPQRENGGQVGYFHPPLASFQLATFFLPTCRRRAVK